MSDTEHEQPQLPLAGPGARLRSAREALGITRSGIAEKTRISERIIAQMEDGNFAALPSRTYATGFTRSYARAVGLDEKELVEAVRRELGLSAPIPVAGGDDDYEPADPARVPSAQFAWWLALAALVLVAGGLWYWRNYYAPSPALPSLIPTDMPTIEPTFTTEASAPPIDSSASTSVFSSEAPNPAFTLTPQVPAAARAPVQHSGHAARQGSSHPATAASDVAPGMVNPATSPAASSPTPSTVTN